VDLVQASSPMALEMQTPSLAQTASKTKTYGKGTPKEKAKELFQLNTQNLA